MASSFRSMRVGRGRGLDLWHKSPTFPTMCGRIAVTLPPDAMAQLFAAAPANDLPHVPNFNVCPTDPVHVVRSDGSQRSLGAMRWGFIPQWYKKPNDGPLLINARAETIADKPAFRSACRDRRCVVLATGFYEWTKDADGNRLPWYITRRDGAPLTFAAIWQDWEGEIPGCGPAPLSPRGPTQGCPPFTTGCRSCWSRSSCHCGWEKRAKVPPA